MSDGKFEWLGDAKTIGIGLVTTVVGILVRLLFGRAILDLDEKLGEIPKLRAELTKLQGRLDRLEAGPPPQPTPKVGP